MTRKKNLRTKFLAGLLAVVTAATPVASYASVIDIDNDIVSISTETDEETQSKFLFITLKTKGGSVILNKDTVDQQVIKLDYHDVKVDEQGNTEKKLFIEVYDKDEILLFSEDAEESKNTYMYEVEADKIVTVDAVADEGYGITGFEGTKGEVEEDTGFDDKLEEELRPSFTYPVFMDEDTKVSVKFGEIPKEEVPPVGEESETEEETEVETDVDSETGDDLTVEQPESEPEEDLTVDESKDTEVDDVENEEDLTVDKSEEEPVGDTEDDLTVNEGEENDVEDDLTVEQPDESGDSLDEDLTVGSDEDKLVEEPAEEPDTDTEEDLTVEQPVDETEETPVNDSKNNTLTDDTEKDKLIEKSDSEAETEADAAADSKTEDDSIIVDENKESEEHFIEINEMIYSLDSRQFESARLVILTDNPDDIIDKEHVIASYDNIYLMQYKTVEQAMNAYLYYENTVQAIEPDTSVEMAGEEVIDDTESENNIPETIESKPESEPEPEVTEPEMPVDITDTEEATDIPTESEPEVIGTTPTESTEIEITSDVNPLTILADTGEAMSSLSDEKVIALIDTGVYEGANILDRVSMIDDDVEGLNNHGNEMVAAIVSQNENAQILSIRALDNNGQGTISAIVAGIEYAMEQDVDIINLSLYAKTSLMNKVLETEIQKAIDMGIEVVGAAGNSGANVIDFVPGNVDAAWILGAADSEGKKLDTSNYGTTVDFNVVAASTSEAAAKFSGYISLHDDVQADNKLIFETDYVPTDEDNLTGEEKRIYLSISENIEIQVDKHHAKPGEKVRFKVIGKNGVDIPYGYSGVEQQELENKDVFMNVSDAQYHNDVLLPGGTAVGYDVDEEDKEYYYFYMPNFDVVVYAYESTGNSTGDIETNETVETEYVYEKGFFDGEEIAENYDFDAESQGVERIIVDEPVDSYIEETGNEGVPVYTFDDTFIAAASSIPIDRISNVYVDVTYASSGGEMFVPPNMGGIDCVCGKTMARTLWKRIRYTITFDDGTKEDYNVPAYCLEPSESDPNGGAQDPNDMEEITSGAGSAYDKIMARILYYGYGGPGWNKTTVKNGTEYNLKKFLVDKYGLSSSHPDYRNQYYAVTHYMLAYEYYGNAIFDSNGQPNGIERNKLWGYGTDHSIPYGYPGHYKYAFNTRKHIVNSLAHVWNQPIPKVQMTKDELNMQKFDNPDDPNGLWFKSDDIFFSSIASDRAYIEEIPEGMILKNLTTGTNYTGPLKKKIGIAGGQKWRIEVDYNAYTKAYGTRYITMNWTTKLPNNFSAYKLKTGQQGDGIQDLGFLFYGETEPIVLKGVMKKAPGTPTPTPSPTATPTPTPPGSTPPPPGEGGGGLYVKKTSTVDPEILALNGYSLEGAEFEVTSDRSDGASGTLVTKEDGISNTLTLPNNSRRVWHDPVYDANDNLIHEGYWEIIPVTTIYTIRETKPPKGHKPNYKTESISVTMPDDNGRTFEVHFEDEPIFCKNKLDIEKLGSKGNPVEGVVFKVEFFDSPTGPNGDPVKIWYLESDVNGKVYMDDAHIANRLDFESDDFFMHNGKIVIPIDGYLQFTEVAAPAEYIINEKPFGLPTGEDLKLEKRAYNEPHPCEVKIKKYEADGVTPISGVEFEIKFLEESIHANGNKHPNFKRLLEVGETYIASTNENGELIFKNLDQGKYQITEIRTQTGHGLLKEPIIVTLPMTMTEEEANGYGNVDFDSAKLDESYTDKWYFYGCLFEVTNNANLKMPMSGGLGDWKYGFIGMGIITMIGTSLIANESLKKKRKTNKQKLRVKKNTKI